MFLNFILDILHSSNELYDRIDAINSDLCNEHLVNMVLEKSQVLKIVFLSNCDSIY